MIQIGDSFIPETELSERFIRCGGPGGQNVNKVNSGVQLRFNVLKASGLSPALRERLIAAAGNRVNRGGEIVIEATAHRIQARNRQDARNRLIRLFEKAAETPRQRRVSWSPPEGEKERRLQAKRRRGDRKQMRRGIRKTEEGWSMTGPFCLTNRRIDSPNLTFSLFPAGDGVIFCRS